MKQLLTLIILIASLNAEAQFLRRLFGKKPKVDISNYIISNTTHEGFQPDIPTHIIVGGRAGDDDADDFIKMAATKAKIYQQLYPDHQVIILSSPQVRVRNNVDVFTAIQLPLTRVINNSLTHLILIDFMKNFSQIKSFDYFGHTNPWAMRIYGSNGMIKPSTAMDSLSTLKDNFTDDAYATINGCNSGFEIAPLLSKAWEIPVSGSLTSGVVEYKQANGQYAKYYETTSSCLSVGCYRMKPVPHNYNSVWGNFGTGLSFFKFFCNYEHTPENCQRNMAKSLLAFPSYLKIGLTPTKEQYKKVVIDYLCHAGGKLENLTKCEKEIDARIASGNKVFAYPGNSNQAQCTFNGCETKVVCQSMVPREKSSEPPPCRIVAPKNNAPTATIEEFENLMLGFDYL